MRAFDEVDYWLMSLYPDRESVRVAELEMIRTQSPKYNILGAS